jgi:hypothetical protein
MRGVTALHLINDVICKHLQSTVSSAVDSLGWACISLQGLLARLQ